MAFISNKNRENIIKRINKSYGFRKFLICLEMALLVGFIAMTFACLLNEKAWTVREGDKIVGLTTLGWGMLAWAIVMVVLGVITLILILTLKSPKKITQEVTHLESSAISGKKVKRTDNTVKVYKERTTVKPKKEK